MANLSLCHSFFQVKDNVRNNKNVLVPVKSLSDILAGYGESDKSITYLKVDIEGSELTSIENWIKTDALKNVQQIGIELHTGIVHLQEHKITDTLSKILKAIKIMCQKYGFKIIDYGPNGCVGKTGDKKEGRYYTYFDIVLYKP